MAASLLHALPTPKRVSSVDGTPWYRFYAMFSELFAREVLGRAGLDSNSTVLEPWLGVGTTTTVAAELGFRSVGSDINPVMVAIASGRLSSRAEVDSLLRDVERRLARTAPPIEEDDPLRDWFAGSAARELRQWQRCINAAAAASADNQRAKAANLALTCLFDVASTLAIPYRSRNPTWIRVPAAAVRVRPAAASVRQLIRAAVKERLSRTRDVPLVARTDLRVASSTALPFGLRSEVDFVLTSPPYCTRIDYAVTTRVELAVLGLGPADLRALRDSSMGTSTIRATRAVSTEESWGPTCRSVLGKIASHPSKNSSGYYLKTHRQYFHDLNVSISEIDAALRPGGAAVFVVQDSYYKGARTDLAQIVVEMGEPLGWSLTARSDFAAIRNMRKLNTRSRRYAADTEATESVLWLTKGKA